MALSTEKPTMNCSRKGGVSGGCQSGGYAVCFRWPGPGGLFGGGGSYPPTFRTREVITKYESASP